MLLLKLKCGASELNLFDRVETFPREDQIKDEGQTVTVQLYLKLASDVDRASQEVQALLHDLLWYRQQAYAYEQMHVGEPVYLGMKFYDGNSYDTLMGRGWVWKRLSGAGCIQHTLDEDWMLRMEDGKLATTLVFTCAPVRGYHSQMVYAWQPWGDRWVGRARGAIRTTDQGGLFLEGACTNLLPNSDFENEADTDLNWITYSADGLTSDTENSDPDLVWNGYFSQLLVNRSGVNSGLFYQVYTPANTNPHTLSCYVRRLDGSPVTSSEVKLAFHGVQVVPTFTAQADRPGWYRVSYTGAVTVAAKEYGIYVLHGETVIVDSFQLEEGSYASSLVYGNLGRGYSFSGTAHNSTSVRAAAGINYRNAVGTVGYILPQDKGTVLVVWKAPRAYNGFSADPYFFYCGSMRAWYDISPTRQFSFTDGTNTVSVAASAFAADDVLFLFFRYGPSGLAIRVYNASGALLGATTDASYGSATSTYFLLLALTCAASAVATGYTPPTPNVAFWLGSDGTPAGQCGEVQELQIWREELTAAECEARAKAGRGEGQMPYLWSLVGTGAVYNHDDASEDNWVEFGNAPGDFDAGLKLFVTNSLATTPLYLYVGQMRRAVPRSDLPSKRYLVGCFYDPWLEAEDGSASYDANTSTVADANCSAGNKARVSPSTTAEVKRINVPVCNEPEDLWKYLGRWRCILRTYTANADRFQIRLRAVTGAYAADYTPQVYADADSVWRPLTPTDQWLDVPAFAIDPKLAQEFRPGDWAAAVDGVYCYIEVYVQAGAAAGSVDIDGILMLPQDNEGMVTLASTADWPQNRVIMLDSIGDVSMAIVHDQDGERLKSGGLYEGTRFTLPVREPCGMAFMWRRSGTGYPWTISDNIGITAKIRPRYQKVC